MQGIESHDCGAQSCSRTEVYCKYNVLYVLFFVQEEFGQNRLTAVQEAAWFFGQTLQLATV